MLDWTDRHCRYFLRRISRHTRLYTEMVSTAALLNGDRDRLLRFNPSEHPLALQLGGSDPGALAECARIGEDYGYDEINLNVGCPSNRVQSGRFGACLMVEPGLVAECIAAMGEAISVPVTVKTRIGIDDQDSYAALAGFISTVRDAGCRIFIIHARKAYLKGLSPRENRTIPPLKYDYVNRIKRQFPELVIVLNGGISDLDEADSRLQSVDGVMLGRRAYHDPYLLAGVDARYFGDDHPVPTREQIVRSMLPYIQRELKSGAQLKHISRHMLGLFQGEHGARHWRRHLSQSAPRPGAAAEIILQALEQLESVRDVTPSTTGYYSRHG